ncbi:hypothetical protein [Agrobacterium vitis]|uniref:HEPN domain-containing protein n=1 Tax=Agrobacterium vitis TaxID=373 RepID=A0A7K1RKK1_AGRVI|nr:hypothetical protein [Agrobacterium vitis]MVA58535.1 hypothetical protein [Agrobacterium vitis]
MSHRLTTAIRICDAAKAILRKTRSFPGEAPSGHDAILHMKEMGVEPMLLALAMELALKAWFVFDFDDPKHSKSHDLSKLFGRLKSESQEKLDQEFKKSVAPYHPNIFYVDYGIEHVLYQHKDVFVDWRYMHEPKSTMFERGAFEATLEMVLSEFDKRYYTVPEAPR